MIGNRVRVVLTPNTIIRGELRKLDPEGIYIYTNDRHHVGLQFYPMHRVLQIDDDGPVYR